LIQAFKECFDSNQITQAIQGLPSFESQAFVYFSHSEILSFSSIMPGSYNLICIFMGVPACAQ